jgi:small subunit ribosomal protein S8
VDIPASRLKVEIARLLKESNFITDYKTLENTEGKKVLRVALKYAGGTPVIRQLQRVSSPGLRQYVGATEIPRVRNGLGVAILSTSKGLMTDREARQARTGGELLAYVW